MKVLGSYRMRNGFLNDGPRSTEVQQTRPVLFSTCPNCQTSDTDSIWLLVIGSGDTFRANDLGQQNGNWGTERVKIEPC